MNREEKSAVIDQVAGEISAAQAIFAVDYRGITVSQVAELRGKLRDSGARLRVVKNSLTERAADQAGVSELKSLLVGPTALAFVEGDAALAAKALSDTNRTLRILDFKGGLMNGAVLSAADVQSIARLPAREVLHAQLVGTIASPLSGLVRTLNALIGGLALQLGQIANMDPPALVSGAAPDEPQTAEVPAAEAEPAAEPEAEPAVAEPEPAAAEEPPAAEKPPAAEEPAAAEEPPAAEAEAQSEPETETETEGTSDDEPSDEKE